MDSVLLVHVQGETLSSIVSQQASRLAELMQLLTGENFHGAARPEHEAARERMKLTKCKIAGIESDRDLAEKSQKRL